jgi:hypothetical protein
MEYGNPPRSTRQADTLYQPEVCARIQLSEHRDPASPIVAVASSVQPVKDSHIRSRALPTSVVQEARQVVGARMPFLNSKKEGEENTFNKSLGHPNDFVKAIGAPSLSPVASNFALKRIQRRQEASRLKAREISSCSSASQLNNDVHEQKRKERREGHSRPPLLQVEVTRKVKPCVTPGSRKFRRALVKPTYVSRLNPLWMNWPEAPQSPRGDRSP